MWKIFELFRKPTPSCGECGQTLALCVEVHTYGQSSFCGRRCVEAFRLKRAAGFQSPWYLGAAALLAFFMTIFATTHHPRAHSPDTHQADDLSNAKSDAYGVCCNGEDYVRVSTWETTAEGYRVMYKGQWFEASRRVKVSNMDNPDGEAKVWINGPEGGPFYIRCFMPGARS